MKKIPLKICGITNVKSVEVAHKNKIKSLGFASKSLNGPNTASEKKFKIKNIKIKINKTAVAKKYGAESVSVSN